MPIIDGRLTCCQCGADLGDADDPYRDPDCERCLKESLAAEADAEFPTLEDLATRCRQVIARAEGAGVVIDDGNVVDLCADNIPASLADIRSALVVAGLAARFPRATSYGAK